MSAVGVTLPLDYTISTTTQVPCIVFTAEQPKPQPYLERNLYLRMTLIDMYFLFNYMYLNSTETQDLNYFLMDSLRPEYQQWSSGKFLNLTIVQVQHPVMGQSQFNKWPINPSPACSVVDFIANFTGNLTSEERTKVVDGTYAKSLLSNRGGASLTGRYGTNLFASTKVGTVLYITPQNLAIVPSSPCVVFNNENTCRHGGFCVNDFGRPKCICLPGYEGKYCAFVTATFLSPEWPPYAIALLVVAAVLTVALLVLLISCCACNPNRL